jgi:predicted amidohydrolase
MREVKIALVQMQSGADIGGNIAEITKSVADAAAQGAQIVVTPENVAYMPMDETAPAFTEENHPVLQAGKKLAAQHQVYLLLGSLLVKDGQKKYNRSIFINPEGEIAARYDKIHLFDVQLSATERHGESAYFSGGDKAVALEIKFGTLGFTVCYDLRFPLLFQTLALRGAECIFVPAAFVQTTGERGHWETLLRARAIENRCFIVGVGQCGTHGPKSRTYGHSMVINPDGEIITKAGPRPAVFTATIDLDEVKAARESIPCLQNIRPFT